MPFKASEPLELIYQNGMLWLVATPFSYTVNTTTEVRVPVNFVTDMASVPQLFWNLLPPQGGNYGKAAVIHDYLYHFAKVHDTVSNQDVTIDKATADNIFFQAMTDLGVSAWRKYTIYYGVKVGGFKAWNAWRTYMTSPGASQDPNEWLYSKIR